MAVSIGTLTGTVQLENKVTPELKNVEAGISSVSSKFGNLGATLGKISSGISSSFREAATGLKELGSQAGPAGEAMGSVVEKGGKLVSTLGSMGPIGIAAAAGIAAVAAGVVALGVAAYTTVSTIASLTQHAADAGDELFTLSNKTGLSVEAIGELKFISQQTDVPLETMTGSITKLGQNLSEGGKKTAAGVKAIGSSFTELRSMRPEDAFKFIIEKLHEIPDAGKRAAAGAALFGKQFKEIAGLTREDMKGMAEEAQKSGLIMSTEFAVAGDRFNDAMGKISMKIDSIKNQIGAVFLPVATAFVETFGSAFVDAFSTAGGGATTFADTFEKVATFIVVDALPPIVSGLVAATKMLVDFFTGHGITAAFILDSFASIVDGVNVVIKAIGLINPTAAAMGAVVEGLAKKAHGIAEGTAAGIAAVRKPIFDTLDAIDKATTTTAKNFPEALVKVKAEVASSAEAMRKAQADAKGFGHALGEAGSAADDAAEKVRKKMEVLSTQIDNARKRGMSLSDQLRIFGTDAIKAADDAEQAGVKIESNVADIATEMQKLVTADYMGKVAVQFQDGVDKIIEAEDKRQQKGLSALLVVATANINYEKSQVDLYRTGTDLQIVEIERKRDAELLALPVVTAANQRELEIRKTQIREAAQWQIDNANGLYHTLNELERASGEQTVADLQETAAKSVLLYEQIRDSGAFSAEAVQRSWEASIQAQAKAVGGLKGDVLSWYAQLGTELSSTLADMATHWNHWKDDLKKIWSDIAGDFTKMLANMLKRFIEGFLMKMLDSITGSRGAFSEAWGSVGSGGGGGGGAGGWGGLIKKGIGLFGGGGAGAIGAVGGTGVEAGIPIFSTAAGLGTPVAGGAAGTFAGTGGGLSGGVAAAGTAATIAGGAVIGGAGFGLGALGQKMFGRGAGSAAFGGASGAATGALIGTMVFPGVGTAIGALIGGLSGVVGGLINFGPSKKEKAARGEVASFQEKAFGGLSDVQKSEAGKAGWSDPQAAGTLIAVRDAYIAIGKSGADAERDVKAMWDAEKKGPEAVLAAMAPMQEALDAYQVSQAKQKEAAEATSAALEAQKTKYTELKDHITTEMKSLSDELDALNKSEAPEEHMGSIEKKSRERIAARQAELDQEMKAAEAQNAQAVDEITKNGQAALDALKQPVKDLGIAAVGPEGLGQMGNYLKNDLVADSRTSFYDIERQYAQGIKIPYRFVQEGDSPPAAPPQETPEGHAVGTFGRFLKFGAGRHVILHGDEAVVPESAKEETAARWLNMGAAAPAAGGSMGGGGNVTNLNVTIQAWDGNDVARVVGSPAFRTSLARQLPLILTDNIESSRTNTRRSLGVS